MTSAFLYGLYLQFFNKNISKQTATRVINFPHTDCQPERTPCSVRLGDRQLRFFLPEKAFYLKAFPVQVWLAGFSGSGVEAVRIRFEMPDMDMGLNQLRLSVKNGSWQGRAILPVCSSGSNDWLATLDVITGAGVYRARFNFVVAGKE